MCLMSLTPGENWLAFKYSPEGFKVKHDKYHFLMLYLVVTLLLTWYITTFTNY